MYIYADSIGSSGFQMKGRLVPTVGSTRRSSRGLRHLAALSEADVQVILETAPAIHCDESRNPSDCGTIFTLAELLGAYPNLNQDGSSSSSGLKYWHWRSPARARFNSISFFSGTDCLLFVVMLPNASSGLVCLCRCSGNRIV